MKPFEWWMTVGLLAARTLELVGCDYDREGCAPVGYASGFHLRFERPAWEPAVYRFEGETEDGPYTCTIDADHVSACEPGWVTFDPWGPALDVLVFWKTPRTVTGRLYRNDDLLGEGAFEPRYHRAKSVDGCGTPLFATDTIALPGPTPCGIDETCRCVLDDGCGCATDAVPARPWSVCPAGTIPSSSCSPGCACDGPRHVCVPGCEETRSGRRSLCIDGAWSCGDPAFPIAEGDCVSP